MAKQDIINLINSKIYENVRGAITASDIKDILIGIATQYITNPEVTVLLDDQTEDIDSMVSEYVDLIEIYRDQTIEASKTSTTPYDLKGAYNVVDNVPTLSSSVFVGLKPIKYDVTTSGSISFGGINFSSGSSFNVGDALVQSGNQWYRQPIASYSIDKLDKIDSNFYHKNLADPTFYQIGKVMGTDGIVLNNANLTLTGRIPIKPGFQYTGRGVNDVMRYIVYYNSSGEIIGGINMTDTLTFTAPINSDSVVITFRTTDVDTFQLEQSGTPTYFLPFSKYLLTNTKVDPNDIVETTSKRFVTSASVLQWDAYSSSISNLNGYFAPSQNLANPSEYQVGKVMGTDGVILNSPSLTLTGHMPITPGLPYSGKGDNNNMRYIVYYNSSGSIIGGINAVQTTTFTAPVSSSTVRVSFNTTDISSFQFEQSATPTSYFPYGGSKFQSAKIYPESIVESPTHRFVSSSQIVDWDSASVLNSRFTQVNLANPANFVPNQLVQSNGIPVTSPSWANTGNIPVIGGQSYRAFTSDGLGARYAVFKNASNQVISGGWDGVNTAAFTAPISASYYVGSFSHTLSASIMMHSGSVVQGFVPYGTLVPSGINLKAADVSQDSNNRFVSDSEKTAVTNVANIMADRFRSMELKGLIQPRVTQRSPFLNKVPNFASKMRLKTQDVTVLLFDGSESTDINYCTERSDAPYRPPMSTEYTLPSYIEEHWRWKGQQYRRYDSKTTPTGSVDTFTCSGSVQDKWYDDAWDWQFSPTNRAYADYNGMTRIVSQNGGQAATVKFLIPDSIRRYDFLYRTDYLSSDVITITVAGGNTNIEFFNGTSWESAHGKTFSANEDDVILPYTFSTGAAGTSTGFRPTIFQKRLMFRRTNVGGSVEITLTSSDGGRICFWGSQYSPANYMFNFINYARGSHNIATLQQLEAYTVDHFKPDLILYACNTVNEMLSQAGSNQTDTPETFTARFTAYIDRMLNKSWSPELIAYTQFTTANQQIVTNTDLIHYRTFGGLNRAHTVFDYYDTLYNALLSLEIGSMTSFYEIWRYGVEKAKLDGTTIYQALWGVQSAGGDGVTSDGTHWNDLAQFISWRHFEKYLTFY
jgi:hypothetical protein